MNNKAIFLTFIVLFGFASRLFVSRLGHNFDLESYWIVGEIITRGGNVYSETSRYNYGPVWFYIVGFFYWITEFFGRGLSFFGFLISFFLSFVDLGIFYILYKKYNLVTASFFFLNPISIIITGYHRQFDNFAILIALFALYLLPKNISFKKTILTAIILGFSITVKHVFFLFPLWLFFSNDIKGWRNKVVLLVLPVTIFITSFIPYWQVGSGGIIQNVFNYKSFANSPFWYLFSPVPLYEILSSKLFFIIVLTWLGLLFRGKNIFELGLIYTLSLVIFAPAIANQYLAIVVPAISVFPNVFFSIFSYLSLIHLIKDTNGLGFSEIVQFFPGNTLLAEENFLRSYDIIILALLIGFSYKYGESVFEAMKNFFRLSKRSTKKTTSTNSNQM